MLLWVLTFALSLLPAFFFHLTAIASYLALLGLLFDAICPAI